MSQTRPFFALRVSFEIFTYLIDWNLLYTMVYFLARYLVTNGSPGPKNLRILGIFNDFQSRNVMIIFSVPQIILFIFLHQIGWFERCYKMVNKRMLVRKTKSRKKGSKVAKNDFFNFYSPNHYLFWVIVLIRIFSVNK